MVEITLKKMNNKKYFKKKYLGNKQNAVLIKSN
jgi:hypothetical protein